MQFYILFAIVIIWLIILSFVLWKTKKFYSKIFVRKKASSIEEIIEKILNELEEEKIERLELIKKLQALTTEAKKHLKYSFFFRFNPFKELTEGQSFVLVLLDENQDGLILNFIYSHNNYRIYPKMIEDGKGKNVELTKEEENAIKLALKQSYEK